MLESAIRDLVIRRASDRCEYCQVSQSFFDLTFHVDHVITRQHGGTDDAANLALSCPACNVAKGPNIAGIDPQTGQVTPLFDPRKNSWDENFGWNSPILLAKTATARATIFTLQLNREARVKLRSLLKLIGQSASD